MGRPSKCPPKRMLIEDLKGMRKIDIARKYGVNESTIYKWMRRYSIDGKRYKKCSKVLEEEDILLSRKLRWIAGLKISTIAEKFGVSTAAMSDVVNYRSWRYVEDDEDLLEFLRQFKHDIRKPYEPARFNADKR